MAATRGDIRGWLEEGRRAGATHVLIVCDTFDHDDYPVYVQPGEDPRVRADAFRGQNMQSLMEVYALHLDLETQLNEHRSFHYEIPANIPAKKPRTKAAKKTPSTKKAERPTAWSRIIDDKKPL
jgi:hypothetical protein